MSKAQIGFKLSKDQAERFAVARARRGYPDNSTALRALTDGFIAEVEAEMREATTLKTKPPGLEWLTGPIDEFLVEARRIVDRQADLKLADDVLSALGYEGDEKAALVSRYLADTAESKASILGWVVDNGLTHTGDE